VYDFCKILHDVKTIAVVGISHNPNRTSRDIAAFLQMKNYRVVGVNPATPEIEGMEVFKSLKDIPFKIDLVNVFRKSKDIAELIPDVIDINPDYLWLQLGIRNDEAVKPVLEIGIKCVQDYCIKVEYLNCFGWE